MSLPLHSLILWPIHLVGKLPWCCFSHLILFAILIVNLVSVTMVLKVSKISLHATSAPEFALQWTCAWCLIYKLLCWTCRTQVQTWAMTLRTIRLTMYSFNTVCILSFPLVIRYLLYLYFIYNIIACCVAFAVVIWWLVRGFCTYGVKHLRNILARRRLLRTCERKSKHPSQISKFILALSAFCSQQKCSHHMLLENHELRHNLLGELHLLCRLAVWNKQCQTIFISSGLWITFLSRCHTPWVRSNILRHVCSLRTKLETYYREIALWVIENVSFSMFSLIMSHRPRFLGRNFPFSFEHMKRRYVTVTMLGLLLMPS